MDIYQANKIYLSEKYNSLSLCLDMLANNELFVFEKAKNGEFTVSMLIDNRKHYLHSLYNPSKEAEKFIENVYDVELDVFFVLSGGLGYHLIALANRLHDKQKIVLLEPYMFLFKKSMCIHNYRKLFHDGFFILDTTNQNIFQAKLQNLLSDIMLSVTNGLKISYIDFFGRNESLRQSSLLLRNVVDDCLKIAENTTENISSHLKELSKSGLVNEFLGEYNQCLANMKIRCKAHNGLSFGEIGLLAAYFLFSHYSYQENFDKGKEK